MSIRILLVVILGAVAVVVMFPFYAMTIMSTYRTAELFRGLRLVPGDFFMDNFRTLLRGNFFLHYRNSIFIATTTSFLSVFVSAMGGYGLSMYSFKGKNSMMAIILLTIMIPMQIAIVGLVMQVYLMGLGDTHLILILLGIPSAFGIFWMSSYARQAIPMSCIESAHIDGCNDFNTFIRIGLPFMMPACGVLFLLVFIGSWNSFLIPTILLSTETRFTLPISIRLLAHQFGVDLGAQLAGLTIGTLPILAVFASFSKTLVQGLSAAAVKE